MADKCPPRNIYGDLLPGILIAGKRASGVPKAYIALGIGQCPVDEFRVSAFGYLYAKCDEWPSISFDLTSTARQDVPVFQAVFDHGHAMSQR
jgi:hypothetical protein